MDRQRIIHDFGYGGGLAAILDPDGACAHRMRAVECAAILQERDPTETDRWKMT